MDSSRDEKAIAKARKEIENRTRELLSLTYTDISRRELEKNPFDPVYAEILRPLVDFIVTQEQISKNKYNPSFHTEEKKPSRSQIEYQFALKEMLKIQELMNQVMMNNIGNSAETIHADAREVLQALLKGLNEKIKAKPNQFSEEFRKLLTTAEKQCSAPVKTQQKGR
jgi:RecA-family ATPase